MADTPNSTPRRAFLARLAGLPLIGGSVTLIGQPTAAAVPVTDDLLWTYASFLHYERRILGMEMFEEPGARELFLAGGMVGAHHDDFHFPAGRSWRDVPMPSTRAAVVLAAAGANVQKRFHKVPLPR